MPPVGTWKVVFVAFVSRQRCVERRTKAHGRGHSPEPPFSHRWFVVVLRCVAGCLNKLLEMIAIAVRKCSKLRG